MYPPRRKETRILSEILRDTVQESLQRRFDLTLQPDVVAALVRDLITAIANQDR